MSWRKGGVQPGPARSLSLPPIFWSACLSSLTHNMLRIKNPAPNPSHTHTHTLSSQRHSGTGSCNKQNKTNQNTQPKKHMAKTELLSFSPGKQVGETPAPDPSAPPPPTAPRPPPASTAPDTRTGARPKLRRHPERSLGPQDFSTCGLGVATPKPPTPPLPKQVTCFHWGGLNWETPIFGVFLFGVTLKASQKFWDVCKVTGSKRPHENSGYSCGFP